MDKAGAQRSTSPIRTLGDVLDAERARTATAETDWTALVRGVAAGDQPSLHELYARTHRLVFTLAVRLTSSPQIAEELTVDVFHDVWRRAREYDPDGGSVVGWIMNQARSRAIDRLRYEGRRKRINAQGEEPLAREGATPPDEQLEMKEQALILRAALTQLAPAEREAIEVAFFSELTYAETAVHLDAPIGTIKTRIRSGLTKLREALGKTR